MKLYHDNPASKGAENALKRAKQMVGAHYTPLRQLPISVTLYDSKGGKQYVESMCTAGFPLTGMVYSSVRRVEKYLGFNVSLETFYSALSNPNSVLYNRMIEGTGQNVHCWYGIVCSCFVSYVLDFPYRTPCIRIPDIEGMEKLSWNSYDELQLLDVVLDVMHHVAIITDIERDADGHVRYITVSESVLPYCRATRFTPAEFKAYWLDDPTHSYELYRYKNLDKITYTPSPFSPVEGDPCAEAVINRTLMTDFGNKANYILGQDPVELSVFDPAFTTVAVTDPDGETKQYPVKDGKVVLKPEKPGFYSACCVSGDKKSPAVEWCMIDLTFTTDKTSYRAGEPVKIRFRNSAKDALRAWQFNQRVTDRGMEGGHFTGLGCEGEITVPAPKKTGPAELYLIARNDYGFYGSARLPLEVTE